jgi:NADPH:quinone reductase
VARVLAVRIDAHGGPEVLRAVQTAQPVPGPGEVLVRHEVIGVNYVDTQHRAGAPYPVQLPLVPGIEAAGQVVGVGPGVDGLREGDRVAYAGPMVGVYAGLAAVPQDVLVPVPDELTSRDAAAVLLQGMTAQYLTHTTYPVQPGDTVLVHAAAGGVGLLLTQLATARGARVVGVVSTAEKEELARGAGAVEVLRPSSGAPAGNLAAAVRGLAGGVGVPVVFDGVGRDTVDASLASLRRRGTLVVFGAASGPVPPVDPQRLNAAGSVYLTRPKLADYVATRAELTHRAAAVYAAVADGTVTVRIGHRYPLDRAAEAHTELEGRRTAGKVLLVREPAG